MADVLLLRGWQQPPYDATFSSLHDRGVGGTELQLLLHAHALLDEGHRVTVVGMSRQDLREDGVDFLAVRTATQVCETLKSIDIIFTNVTTELAALRMRWPRSTIVQVCQNGPDLKARSIIDVYAFVGDGQLASFAAKYRRYRHKFVLLPNAVPIESIYRQVALSESSSTPMTRQVTWVGGLTKQGLRRWGKAMEKAMEEFPDLNWLICSPAYSVQREGMLPPALLGLNLPIERLSFRNLPLRELAKEIIRSEAVLVSLGGEDGPVSYLDGHALGVPVLSGDDIVGFYWNPSCAGIRCSTAGQCHRALTTVLSRPDVGRVMGASGQRWSEAGFGEARQRAYLNALVATHVLRHDFGVEGLRSVQSDRKESVRYYWDRLQAKLRFAVVGRFRQRLRAR